MEREKVVGARALNLAKSGHFDMFKRAEVRREGGARGEVTQCFGVTSFLRYWV